MPIRIKSISSVGYTQRELSDAVNQLGQFGSEGTNVYGGDKSGQSFVVPAGHFESTGAFRVNDANIKVGSFIIIDPTNTAAIIATVGVVTVGDGFFEVNDPPPELMFAVGSISQNNGILAGGLSGGVVLPFDTKSIEENITIDLAGNRITSKIDGILQISMTISGLYATNRDYEFGFTKFNIGDVNQGTFTLQTSTANQNDIVSVGGIILDGVVAVGDYYIPLGLASGVNVTFTYDMSMGFSTISPARGVIVTDEVTYDYVVIQ